VDGDEGCCGEVSWLMNKCDECSGDTALILREQDRIDFYTPLSNHFDNERIVGKELIHPSVGDLDAELWTAPRLDAWDQLCISRTSNRN